MSRTLVVKEYDTIVSNESLSSKQGYVFIEEKYFKELEQFIREYVSESDEADILEFMQIGYKRGVGETVTFKSYVGIIELPSGFQIEILPKVSLGEDENNAKTKRIFLKMLNCLKDFEGKVFSSAALNTDKMNLYEIFIRMYIQETWVLVKRGIKSDYISNEDKVSLSRGMKEYELLIQWAKIFLLNKSFTTFSGKNAGKALLFPMEQVFEAFIAKQIKILFENQSNGLIRVSAQDSGYYLFDEPRKFKLRPDIVVSNAYDEAHNVVIMDTKWKRLNSNPATNYGISQADMYQMYAYSKKYHTPNIWLIYPMNDDVRELGLLSFEAVTNEEMNVLVKVFFVDLGDYKMSLQSFYDEVYCSNIQT